MGFMDELKKLARPYAEDDEDDYDDYDNDDFEDEEDEAPEPAPRARRSAPAFSAPESRSAAESRRGGKIVNVHTTAQLQVVLNLESTNKDVARRLVDFLSGCAYALDGKIKKVAISTYIITPLNVDIVGDLVEELENNGMYF